MAHVMVAPEIHSETSAKTGIGNPAIGVISGLCRAAQVKAEIRKKVSANISGAKAPDRASPSARRAARQALYCLARLHPRRAANVAFVAGVVRGLHVHRPSLFSHRGGAEATAR